MILNLLFKFPCSVSLCFRNFCDAINCASVEKRVFPYLIDSLFNTTTSRVTGVVIYLLMPFTLFFLGVARWNWHLQHIWQGDATLLYFLFLFFFPHFFPLVRFHSASRTFLSFAWFLRTLKSLYMNRLRFLLRMRCMLLGYRFEPRPNSPTLGSASSVMTISYDYLDVRTRKNSLTRENEIN